MLALRRNREEQRWQWQQGRTAAENGAPVPNLRRSAVRLTGAVIMSAAIVGPGVSTFWAEVTGLGGKAINKLDGTSLPWPDLAATYASWMKWPVIIASVSSMFAIMINSSNRVMRSLNWLAAARPRKLEPAGAPRAAGEVEDSAPPGAVLGVPAPSAGVAA